MRAVPLVGASRPRMTRIVVLLPAPFGPRKPVTWPGRTAKLSPSTAVTAPKRLTSWSTSIIEAPSGRVGPRLEQAGFDGVDRDQPGGQHDVGPVIADAGGHGRGGVDVGPRVGGHVPVRADDPAQAARAGTGEPV